MKIHKDILEIHEHFKEAGYDLFLVGGCVRDFKLGLEPHDFDMATNAHPDEIIEFLKDKYQLKLTGKNFGVLRVITEAEPVGHEIATYREDKSVGRKPVVKIGATMQQDADRRDFTINALYYDIDKKEIIDLVGGIKDLENKVIRACGDAATRINEDALRMIRAIRFKNSIDGKIHESLHKALKAHPALEGPDETGEIIPIAHERISEEFLKALSKTRDVKTLIDDLIEYDYIGQIFSGFHINTSFTSTSKTPEVLIADLLRDNTSRPALLNGLVERCKFTKEIAKGVILLSDMEFLDEHNAFSFRKRFSLASINLEMADVIEFIKLRPYNEARLKYVEAFTKYEISVNGKDLMEEGFKGEELGTELQKRETENFLKLMI